MKILRYPDPVLSKISDPVKNFDEPLRQMVDEMYKTCFEQPPGSVAGLAAPQIGYNVRVFIALGKLFINPILKLSKGVAQYQEGCFSSAGGPNEKFKVWRSQSLWIDYQDLTGKRHQDKYNGFMAEIIQHEVDHLNGVMCLNRQQAQA